MAVSVPTSRSDGRSGRRIPKRLTAELSCSGESVSKEIDIHGERESSRRTRHNGAPLATWNSRAAYFPTEWHFVSRKGRLLPAQGERRLRHRGGAIRTIPKPQGGPNVILRTDIRADKRFVAGQSIPSRRHFPRVEKAHGVWVYWNCKGLEDTSRVRDLSPGGLFVETEEVRDVGATIRLDFLVQEGQIRAKAVVRHVKPGSRLGLKLSALAEEDGPRLTALMTRLRPVSAGAAQPSH